MNKIHTYDELLTFISFDNVKKDEPLTLYTHTKTGGKADYLILPTTYKEVQDTVLYAKKENIPLTILGNGSNLIVKDGGIRGITLNLTRLTNIENFDQKIIAQSGAAIIETSRFSYRESLTGLEFACGIPGSVGGAVFMNAGAYGGEISDVLESVLVLTRDGELLRLEANELNLSYRHSNISEYNYIVLEATFSLKPGDQKVIKSTMDNLTHLRESKQPLEYPSCGSVFKRPPGLFAGKLIEDSGLQGHQIGGVQVSKKHAGFMVNIENGTATDYIDLISHVQKTVKDKFNVLLEAEVKIIGDN